MKNPVAQAMLSLAEIKERDAERAGSRFSSFYTLILFGLVVAALMVALLFASTVYGAVNNARVDGDESRAALNIIANSIRQADSSQFVTSKKAPEGNALVLVEHTDNGDYETRFYLYQGKLLQEYSREGINFDPEGAVQIAELDEFDFDYDDSLITVRTSKGSIDVAIRSQANEDDSDDDDDGADDGAGEGDTNEW